MTYLNLKVQADDYPFIVAAIKLRTTAIIEGLSMQVDAQLHAPPVNQPPQKPKAPFGVKKDGTPKKRPGRPAK